jgi:tripartite-type tricarboxylate transporter receptor subunit TctC
VDVPGSLVAHPSVPARTMKELVFDAARKSMTEPEVVSRRQASGVAAVTNQSPATCREFVDAEIKQFGTVIREAKITAD